MEPEGKMNTVKRTSEQAIENTAVAGDLQGATSATQPANPYVGPRTFETKERELFFGRDREAQDLLSVVLTERLALFYAQSGAGKSSLINTRLIPGLVEEAEYQVLPVGRLLGEAVKRSDVDNIYVHNLITSLIKRKIEDRQVSKLTLSQFLAGLDFNDEEGYFYNDSLTETPVQEANETTANYVLIIDQFEELFTTHPEEWRKREDFFKQLAQAMDDFSNLSIVLAMREDYIAVLEPYAHLVPGKFRGRYYMQRLGYRAAREAVEGPAARQNRSFVPEVAEKLVNDLSSVKVRKPDGTLDIEVGQYVEPVQLQVVCSDLWEKLPADCMQITQEHVDRYVGDVNNALGSYFKTRVAAVTSDLIAQGKNVSEYAIREWFEKKLITGDGIRNMVAQEPGGISGDLDDFVIQEFVRKGDLIRAEKRGGATFYELTHDRLVEPILQNNREWFETRSDLIQKRAALWLQAGRASTFLLRGRDLRTARRLAKTRSLTKDEQAFLRSSTRAEQIMIFLVITTVVIVGTLWSLAHTAIQASRRASANAQMANEIAAVARDNEQLAIENAGVARENAEKAEQSAQAAAEALYEAEQAQNIAEAQRSAARAQIFQSRGDLYMSTLLGIDSWLKMPSAEVEDILRENISFLPRQVANFEHSGGIRLLDFNPDGRSFAAASADGSVCVWEVETETELFCRRSTTPINDLVFSFDGSMLVTGDASGKLTILDAKKGNVKTEYDFGSDSPVLFLDISSDAKTILIARENGNIRILNVQDYLQNPREIGYLLEAAGKPSISVFSPNGQWVAAGTEAGTVIYWNLSSGYRYTSRYHQGKVLALSFSPDGRYLVSGGEDNYTVILDTRREMRMRSLPHLGEVQNVAFGPDVSWFVTASDDRRVRVWDISGMERFRILQEGEITGLKVSPNGQLITTLGSDQTVRVLNADTGQEVFQIPLDFRGSVVAFSQNGKYLVSGDLQGGLGVWDMFTLSTPAKSILLRGMAENIQYNPEDLIAISDERKAWVLPSEDVYGLSELPRETVVPEFTSRVNQLALSPDSNYLGFTTEGNDVAIVNLYRMSGMLVTSVLPGDAVQDIAFSSNSQKFFTLDAEGRVQAWNTSRVPPTMEVTPKGSRASAIRTGPGLLAVGLSDKILLVDSTSGEILSETEAPGDHILLAFSADGSLLADGNSSGQINLWRQENGQLTPADDFNRPQIVSLALKPDGTLLAVGTAKNVHLIDTETGQEVARIPHVDTVNDLSFAPDGLTLASASSNLIQFWDISNIQPIKTDDLIESACSRLVKNLDKDQWAALFGDEQYRVLCENLPIPNA
jgi:WD40 repeat protein